MKKYKTKEDLIRKLIEDDEDYELDTRHLSFLERKYTLEIIGNIHDKGEIK